MNTRAAIDGTVVGNDPRSPRALYILVVEDERIIALDIGARLRRLGYRVSGTVASGPQALEACEKDPPALVLMDIVLNGGMDGIEAAGLIRERHDIPVVYLTSHADQETLRRAARTAPYGFVIKPGNDGWLQSAIEVALYKHATEIDLKRSEERFRPFSSACSTPSRFSRRCARAGRAADLRILEVNPAFERVTGFPGPRWRTVCSGSPARRGALLDRDPGETASAAFPPALKISGGSQPVFSGRGLQPESRAGGRRHRGRHLPAPRRAASQAPHLSRSPHGPAQPGPVPGPSQPGHRTGQTPAQLRLCRDLPRPGPLQAHQRQSRASAGDKVLRQVAEVLGGTCAAWTPWPGWAGTNSPCCSRRFPRPGDALRVARKIRDSLAQAMLVDGRTIYLSASMGVVLGPAEYERPEELLQNATIAMNHARRVGPGRIRVFDWAMRESAEHDLGVEVDLRRCLHERRFLLHYQPIVRLADGSLAGFEALVRRVRPDGGLDLPGEFIAVAEETGLIVPLGNLILGEACAALGFLCAELPAANGLFVAVNLSAKLFLLPDLVKQRLRALRKAGADPRRLHLEITESVLMDNPESALAKLRGMREMGARIGVDDFGTGYSSLSYLQRFPLDRLKIDRGFVGGMDDQGNMVIVRSVISLAHSLGLEVVAEGIETPRQEAMLKDLGCDFGQGFLYSRPVPLLQAQALVRGGAPWKGDPPAPCSP